MLLASNNGPVSAARTVRPWAVVDLDGVVADTRHRLHLIERFPKDWEGFFAAAVEDPLLPEGAAVAHRLAREHQLTYLTGRPERWRSDTEVWIARVGLPAARVHMRRDSDRRPARMMKLSVLARLATQAPIAMVVDDDPAVVRAVRAAGHPVLHADWMFPSDGAAATASRAAVAAATDQGTLFEAQESDGRT
jgi:hypothetical protein